MFRDLKDMTTEELEKELHAIETFEKEIVNVNVNNLLNKRYFTRRAAGYPGPGALPADGRSFFFTLGAKL